MISLCLYAFFCGQLRECVVCVGIYKATQNRRRKNFELTVRNLHRVQQCTKLNQK